MHTQVIDAIAIANCPIVLNRIERAKTVLYNHQRDAVAPVQLVERPTQNIGVDLLAPIACLKIRILSSTHEVPASRSESGIGRHDIAHVMAEAVEIDGAACEVLQIPFGNIELNTILIPDPLGKVRIFAADLNVAALIITLVHLLLTCDDVGRVAAERIIGHIGDHATDLGIGRCLVRLKPLDEIAKMGGEAGVVI